MTKILALLRGKNIVAFCSLFLVMIGILYGVNFITLYLGIKFNGWQSFLWIYLLQSITLLVLVYFWFYRRFPEERKQIRWSGNSIGQIIKYVLLLFGSYFALILVLNFVKIIFNLDDLPGVGSQVSLIKVVGLDFGLWVAFIAAVIIAPIIEEYVFRGWGMICLPLKSKPYLAVFLNGLLFALFHFEFSIIIPLIYLGCMLAWTRYRSGSILPGIVFHLINNSLALYADYYTFINS